MTESEWLECTELTNLLPVLRATASERQMRLFALACCYRIRHLIPDEEGRRAIRVAEAIVEGDTPAGRLDEFTGTIWQNAVNYVDGFQMGRVSMIAHHATSATYNLLPPVQPPNFDLGGSLSGFLDDFSPGLWATAFCSHSQPDLLETPIQAASAAAHSFRNSDSEPRREDKYQQELQQQLALMRDIIGLLPFRPFSIHSACLTPTVLSLAQAAYNERIMPSGELEPARLAVLADALEEAGCDNPDILAHLRGPGPHVRGCWVLDLLLGKE